MQYNGAINVYANKLSILVIMEMAKMNWDPQHKNESTPGLISDGISSADDYKSVTRADYIRPEKEEIPHARRKKLLRGFIFDRLAEGYITELIEPASDVMDLNSLYRESFTADGFEVKDILESVDPEEMAKYPIYTDMAHSVYYDNLKRVKNSVPTEAAAVFRRCSYFTKPFYAELEE